MAHRKYLYGLLHPHKHPDNHPSIFSPRYQPKKTSSSCLDLQFFQEIFLSVLLWKHSEKTLLVLPRFQTDIFPALLYYEIFFSRYPYIAFP